MADQYTKVGFAKKQLEKHGWSEGKGLGKEESGISKAIKVNIKTDSAGVGYDAGDQFSFHWWDHVFNKTAKSIVVQESEEGVEVVKSSKVTCAVSNKRPSKNTNKPLLYGRFVKASSQTQESKAQESDEDSELEKDFSHLCPEEKLFQACGGRTAHKAARHGFRLNGKLQRVEKQEKLEVTADRCKTVAAECSDSDLSCCVIEEKQQYKEKENKNKKDKDRKKKKRKQLRDMHEENKNKLEDECYCENDDDVDEQQGKTKKRKSRDMQENSDRKFKGKLNSHGGDVEEKQVKKKKRKIRDKKGKNDHKLEEERNSSDDEVEEKRAKKKKRKSRDMQLGENSNKF